MLPANSGNVKKVLSPFYFLLQIAAAIATIIGGFLDAPPIGPDKGSFLSLSRFILAVCLGLVFVLVVRWRERKHLSKWVSLTAVAVVLATSLFFFYGNRVQSWACDCRGTTLVIGKTFTAQGQEYANRVPGVSCGQILFDFGCVARDAWSPSEIYQRTLFLEIAYLLTLLMFALSVISVVQVLVVLHIGAVRP